MKSLYSLSVIIILSLLISCQKQETTAPQPDNDVIQKELKDIYVRLFTSLNRMNTEEWSEFYSKEEFVSTLVSTDFYADREEFIDSISSYISMRESQELIPMDVKVTVLTTDLALITSQENTKITMKTGENINSKHVFTMIWKKEKDGWKIIHSHESWVDEPAKL